MKKSLKEVYMAEVPRGWNIDGPDFNELVDSAVDIFDEMMRGSISDQKYDKMMNDLWSETQQDDRLFKKILMAARDKVLNNTAHFLANEIAKQTD